MFLNIDSSSSEYYDIPRNFILHFRKQVTASSAGIVLSLPALKIRSSDHPDIAICHDILRHPLSLPPRDEPETLPWTLAADNMSMFTVLRNKDEQTLDIDFLLNPMSCRAMLASAKTSRLQSGTKGLNDELKATLDFVVHTDFDSIRVNCSKEQVSFWEKKSME